MARETWFCIDIECSGGVPHLFDMISLGAVRVSGDPGSGFAFSEPFYVEIAPYEGGVDPSAMAVNGLDLDRLRREGLPLPEALARLDAWVAAELQPGTKPTFVGHNAPFDWSFVAYAYRAVGRPNPFGYKALDTKALAMGVLEIPWGDTNKETLEQLLGLPPQDAALVHRADYDAAYQAQILARLLERKPSCVAS